MKKNYYVYVLIDPRNNKIFYIGKGQKKRMYKHERDVQNGRSPNKNNRKLGNKIKKILNTGDKVKYKKVFETDIGQEAFNKEMKLIAEIGLGNLCNLTSGGVGSGGNKGRKLSEEHKSKVSKNHAKYWLGKHRSERSKRKISQSLKGRKFSKETKQKMSENNVGFLGKTHSEETRKKMSKSKKGKTHSKETKQKMSESHKGHPPTKGFSGRKHKLESRIKISEKTKGENNPRFLIYIICSPENDEFQFRGRKEVINFFKQFNIDNELRGNEKISPHNLLKNKINKKWRIIKSIKK